MKLYLMIQVRLTLLHGKKPCFVIFWSCNFYLIFHRVFFGLKIMRNLIPGWNPSTSNWFFTVQNVLKRSLIGWWITWLFAFPLDNGLSHCHMHFERVLISRRGCFKSQTVYLLHHQYYLLVHVWQWNFQYSQEQEPCFLLQIQCFVYHSYIYSFKFIISHTQTYSLR